jgi:hypothetical protein
MPDIKETLIDLLTGYSLDTYEDVQYVADELIAKGVLPVVRCKDCKHFEFAHDCNFHAADENGTPIFVREDDFCSYGERKEAGKDV